MKLSNKVSVRDVDLKGKRVLMRKVKADSAAVKRFAAQLSALGDIYVNDAFGTAHRAHASVVGISLNPRCAGLLLEKELTYFDKALNNPQRPFLSILGGAKVHDKIQLIESLLERVDYMIIGGGMAYTFLKVLRNMPIGNSLYDEAGAKLVPQIMEKAKQRGVEILFPVDFVVSSEYGENGVIKAATLEEGVPDGFESLDCGPRTIKQARDRILQCKTIVWNGPQGVSEMQSFAKGSLGFVDAVVEATKLGAVSIVGGGDTGALVERAGVADKFSHVSTGGGASLELLEGKDLPGVVALSDKH
uniref:phosphoglycerate kinase n=1 Tax=Dermatophagoides pteronyssinus TaxID=6956 RepID=A0A6P6YJL5_DERPT|nr:phosphoglycerate kinase-like [Dermatophagoides pteronyssinus]